jgi:hypothetical protein
VVKVLQQPIVAENLPQPCARGNDGIGDDPHRHRLVQLGQAVADSRHQVRRYLDLHGLPGSNQPVKSGCALDAEHIKSDSQPIAHTWRVVLDLPVVPKSRVRLSEGGLNLRDRKARVMDSHLIDKGLHPSDLLAG